MAVVYRYVGILLPKSRRLPFSGFLPLDVSSLAVGDILKSGCCRCVRCRGSQRTVITRAVKALVILPYSTKVGQSIQRRMTKCNRHALAWLSCSKGRRCAGAVTDLLNRWGWEVLYHPPLFSRFKPLRLRSHP